MGWSLNSKLFPSYEVFLDFCYRFFAIDQECCKEAVEGLEHRNGILVSFCRLNHILLTQEFDSLFL